VISDAHLGLTAAIKRMFQGCSWQRCRVHFLRNLLSHVPKSSLKNPTTSAIMGQLPNR
jgi:transposase-like protein